MWMIWAMLIVGLPIIGLGLWGLWHNKQVDKYNEEQRQKTIQSTTAAA